MAYNQIPAVGQTTSANSLPVVIASDNGVKISTLNTYASSIANPATYTGTSESVEEFSSASVSFYTPFGVNLNGTLWFEVSRNNTDFSTIPRDVRNSSTLKPILFSICEKYFRIRFENGKDSAGATLTAPYASTTTTNLQIQVMYHRYRTLELGNQMGDAIADWDQGSLSKTVLTGRLQSGNYKNIGTDEDSRIRVSIPVGAFDNLMTAQLSPVAQLDFVYGINTQMSTSTVTGSATAATVTSGVLSASTSATASSSCIHVSRRYLKYRPGQGGLATFDAAFTTGVANNIQHAGIATSSLGNGYTFGYNGTAFGIFSMNNAVTTAVAKTAWNYDVMDGTRSTSNPSAMTLDPTKLNLYQIEYNANGSVDYLIMSSGTNEMVLVHRIYVTNSLATPYIQQPSLNLVWSSANTTNTTDITVKTTGGGAFIQGAINSLGPKNSIDNSKTATVALLNVLTIKNATTYNTVTNRAQIRTKTVTLAYDGAFGIATGQLILNTTLGGTPSYTAINGTTADGGVTITSGNSVASYDIAGTTITSGTILHSTQIARNSSVTIDLTPFDVFITPADILTFAVKATVAGGTVAVACNWLEDI